MAEERGAEFFREIGRKGGESRGNRSAKVKDGRSVQRRKARVHK